LLRFGRGLLCHVVLEGRETLSLTRSAGQDHPAGWSFDRYRAQESPPQCIGQLCWSVVRRTQVRGPGFVVSEGSGRVRRASESEPNPSVMLGRKVCLMEYLTPVLAQIEVAGANVLVVGIISVLAGILILAVPRVLNYVVAAYLIVIGILWILAGI
jgi:hypothetical protein